MGTGKKTTKKSSSVSTPLSSPNSTEQLIQDLSSGLAPVTPLESPVKRVFRWLGVIVLCLFAGFFLTGVREDWRVVFSSPILIAQNVLILLGILSSSVAAILLSVPGNERRKSTGVIVLIPFLAWGVLVLIGAMVAPEFSPGIGISCMADISVFAILPASFLFYFLRKGSVLRIQSAGFYALLAAAGVGAWALQFTCHNDELAHLLLWHFLPVLVLGFLGSRLAQFFMKRK